MTFSHRIPRLPTLAAALSLLALSACSSEIELAATPLLYADQAQNNPFDQVPAEWQNNRAKILYATDRVATVNKEGKREFGYARSMALEVGYVTVEMGENLSWPDLVAASRTAKRADGIPLRIAEIAKVGQFPDSNTPPVLVDGIGQDPPEHVQANQLAAAQIHTILKEQLANAKRKEVFLYVHGYNNTFNEAACRMAMLWHFLGREGVPAIYTWPAGSGGILRGYNYDRESGEFTIFHLKQFLRTITSSPDVQKLHIIGHSRGTDVTLTALRELHLEMKHMPGGTRGQLKLKNVVLAAPDLDWEVFNQRALAERIGAAAENVTIYVSEGDRAITLSDWLFQSGQRLGTLLGSDVKSNWQESLKHLESGALVDVKAETDFLGHAYFIDCPEVLSDLILVLRDGKRAGPEHGRPLVRREDGFWEIRNGYPHSPPTEKK